MTPELECASDERADEVAGRPAKTQSQKHRSQYPPKTRAVARVVTAAVGVAGVGAVLADYTAPRVSAVVAVHVDGFQPGAAILSELPDDGPTGFSGMVSSALTPYVVTGGTIGVRHDVGPHPSGGFSHPITRW